MASPLPLSGKVALITGSSRSIGAAIATDLAEDGAKVVINYVANSTAAHDIESAINARHPDSAIAIQADVSTISGGQTLLQKTLAHFGKLDILILNAAIMGSKPLAEIDEKYYDDHMNCNVKGQLFLVQAAAPHLTSGSRIIFLSSSLTKLSTVLPEALVYIATKGAIEQITRALAKDLGAKGITVNTVSPGPTDTDLFREGKSESHIAFIANLSPSKRLGKPEEIAPLVSFLSSPKAQHVNGQTILVNGGYVL